MLELENVASFLSISFIPPMLPIHTDKTLKKGNLGVILGMMTSAIIV